MRKFGLIGLWIRSAAVGPLALVLAFLAAYLLVHWLKRRRTGKGPGGIASVAAFAAVLLALCFPYPAYLLELPILTWAGRIADSANAGAHRDSGRPAVVFVLGGGISAKTSVPSSYSLGRIDHGLKRFREEPGAYFLFTDGGLARENGTEWMRQYLTRAGVPGDRLLLEDRAAATQQNFEFGKKLLEEKGLADARVILVTSAVHLPRAYYTARRYGMTPEVDPLQEHADLLFHPSWFSMLHLSAVLNEYLGLAVYWALGWL